MERKEMLDILKSMCERCLMKGLIQTLDEAKELYEVFDRFYNINYINDEEYSGDIFYLYNLAQKLHISGNTSLEESYSIYNALLTADRVDFVETKEPNIEQTIVNVEPATLKHRNKSKKVKDGVVNISDINIKS